MRERGGTRKGGEEKSSYCKKKVDGGELLRLHQLIGYYKSTSLKK